MLGKIGKKYPYKEKFSWKKLSKAFKLFDGVEWAKDISSLFNLRKLILYTLILSSIFGYGYWKGNQNVPVKIDLGYGKEAIIKLEKNRNLYIAKDGKVYLQDKDGNTLNQISVKDVPGLRKKLSAFGLQLEPILVFGASSSIDGDGKGEVGVGFSLVRFYRMKLDTFITSHPAIYLGSSYKLTENSSIGIGIGTSLERYEKRGIIYYSIKF